MTDILLARYNRQITGWKALLLALVEAEENIHTCCSYAEEREADRQLKRALSVARAALGAEP